MLGTGVVGTQPAPPEIVRQLREIDPAADLIHLGGRAGSAEWLLGIRAPNIQAKKRLEDQIDDLREQVPDLGHHESAVKARVEVELSKELELLQFLHREGFRPIHLYNTEDTSFSQIVKDFRIRDFNWRTRPEEAFTEMSDAASFHKADKWRDEVTTDFWHTEGLGIYRKVFRRAVHVAQRSKEALSKKLTSKRAS